MLESKKSGSWKGTLCLFLVILCICVMAFSIVSTVVNWVYSSRVLHSYDEIRWYHSGSNGNVVCDMPGCSELSTANVSYSIWGEIDVPIENKAGINIKVDTRKVTEREKKVYKEEYCEVTYIGNGTFVAKEQEDRYEYYVDGDTYEVTYTCFGGVYCDAHKDQAVTIFKDELTAATNQGIFAFMGKKVVPYVYWICMFVIGMSVTLLVTVPKMAAKFQEQNRENCDAFIAEGVAKIILSAVGVAVVFGVVWLVFKVGTLVLDSSFSSDMRWSFYSFAAIYLARMFGGIVMTLMSLNKKRKITEE